MGGGVAGLASAVFLDELGFKVTLVEKKPHLGGRAYSFRDRVTGLTVDNGQHLMIGAYHETLQFLQAISARGRVSFEDPTVIPLADERLVTAPFRVRQGRPPLPLMAALWRFKHLNWREKAGFLRLGHVLKRLKSGKATMPVQQTVTEWLVTMGQSEKARRRFWDVVTLATLNDSPDVTTADGLIQVMLGGFFAGPRDGLLVFPNVGLSDVFAHPAENYLTLRGQRILKGVGVKEMRFLGDRAMAVALSDGQILKAEVFVSALPFRQLLNILPGLILANTPALQPLTGFHSAPIVSINLFYDRPVMEEKFLGSAGTSVHWFFRKDTAGPHHVVGVVSGAYDWLEKDKKEAVRIAAGELQCLCPRAARARLVHALVNKEREATLSSRPGVNAARPAQQIYKNFFAVGDWTRTGLPATIESAVKSARLMANTVAASLK
jgi:squalene-associated FAD-dependent desaturase